MIKIFITLVLGLFFTVKVSEKAFENLWSKFIVFKEMPIGIDPASKKEKIMLGNAPVIIPAKNKSEKEAILIIHGAIQAPKRMIHIYNSNKFQQWDCYLPLLMYHRRDLHVMHKINYHKMAQQLLQDILYVAKQYDKVYCIGYSLGANLLCYLSLQKKLPEKVKLVLYAPAIQTKITPLYYAICCMFFNKYIISPDFLRKKTLKSRFVENIAAKRILDILYKSTAILKIMFASGQQISNDFVSILILDDARVPAKAVLKLLSKQKRAVKNVILDKLGHSPHLHPKKHEVICAELLKAIELLKKR